MSETKHTPGPWTYEPGDSMECGCIWAPARMVCDFIEDPNEADARLIAAAPDLLEALRAVDVLFGHLARDSTQRIWLDNARAAIAKATTGV